jgi:glycosyltransferase involved in cell wall biosynthesis
MRTANGDPTVPLAVEVVDVDAETRSLLLLRADGSPYRGAMLIARLAGRPFGVVTVPADADGRVDAGTVASAVRRLPAPTGEERTASGPASNPRISVIVATCARPASVIRCVRSIFACDYDNFEVIVVENAPERSATARALSESFPGDLAPMYLEEPRVGLSHTRNTGLAWATGEIVAFTDDDVVVDPVWLGAIANAFAPEVGCVTGLIMPLSLENENQLLFERFAAFGKGFVRREFSITDQPNEQNRLLPYAAGHLGSGANMAFRTSLARELGGLDPVLGIGTPTLGGEDIDILATVLLSGSKLVYDPAALIFHEHPRSYAGLHRRAFAYGVGLTAMLSKHLVVGPRRQLVARIPAGMRYIFDPASRKNALRGPGYPPAYTMLEFLGMVVGPFAYVVSAGLSLLDHANWRPRFIPVRRRRA